MLYNGNNIKKEGFYRQNAKNQGSHFYTIEIIEIKFVTKYKSVMSW